MATDLNKTLGYYQPFEWGQFPPTPIVSCPAACPALSRRDFFILEVARCQGENLFNSPEHFAEYVVKCADALLREADKTP